MMVVDDLMIDVQVIVLSATWYYPLTNPIIRLPSNTRLKRLEKRRRWKRRWRRRSRRRVRPQVSVCDDFVITIILCKASILPCWYSLKLQKEAASQGEGAERVHNVSSTWNSMSGSVFRVKSGGHCVWSVAPWWFHALLIVAVFICVLDATGIGSIGWLIASRAFSLVELLLFRWLFKVSRV